MGESFDPRRCEVCGDMFRPAKADQHVCSALCWEVWWPPPDGKKAVTSRHPPRTLWEHLKDDEE